MNNANIEHEDAEVQCALVRIFHKFPPERRLAAGFRGRNPQSRSQTGAPPCRRFNQGVKYPGWRLLTPTPAKKISRWQFFTVRQVVAVPADQSGVAGVFKKKLQRRRFDVAVAKHHVEFALVA